MEVGALRRQNWPGRRWTGHEGWRRSGTWWLSAGTTERCGREASDPPGLLQATSSEETTTTQISYTLKRYKLDDSQIVSWQSLKWHTRTFLTPSRKKSCYDNNDKYQNSQPLERWRPVIWCLRCCICPTSVVNVLRTGVAMASTSA